MKRRLSTFITCVGILAACSSTPKVAQESALPISAPIAPAFLEVPHPQGYDLADIRAMFLDAKAPTADALKDCDQAYLKLAALTQSAEERALGAREFVKADPVTYHWCFYGKILELEDKIKSDAYIDEKQGDVLKTYGFLVPVARGFLSEYKDSRYLRWAVKHYRVLSDVVFYRRLELTPEMTSEMVTATDPFPADAIPANQSVLSKYKITPAESAPPVEKLLPPTAPIAPAQTQAAAPLATVTPTIMAPLIGIPAPQNAAIDPNEMPSTPAPEREPATEAAPPAPSAK
jgi:hypothetical protein